MNFIRLSILFLPEHRPSTLSLGRIMLAHCHSPARPHLQSISNALCLMAVMGLGIKQGETITVTVEGDDETARNDRRGSFRAVFCVMQ